jgi:hypothetical protein
MRGYIVYRTDYIPQSITELSRLPNLFNSNIKTQSFSDIGPAQRDKSELTKSPRYLEASAKQGPVIVADTAHFEQGSIHSIYAHYMSWVASQKGLESTTICWECVLFDEKSQQALLCAPLPDKEEKLEAGEKGAFNLQHVGVLACSNPDNNEYDSFMGGELLDWKDIDLIAPKKGARASSDSEDEHDSFLGGFI